LRAKSDEPGSIAEWSGMDLQRFIAAVCCSSLLCAAIQRIRSLWGGRHGVIAPQP
jgi:hypothetical protein